MSRLTEVKFLAFGIIHFVGTNGIKTVMFQSARIRCCSIFIKCPKLLSQLLEVKFLVFGTSTLLAQIVLEPMCSNQPEFAVIVFSLNTSN